MFEPFHLPFVQRGIVEVLVLAGGAGVIGTWIVLRGLAFYAHAVGTAAFPGLVLADGLAFPATLGAAGTGVLVALGVGWLARREQPGDSYDSQTALVLVGALAAGVILSSDVFRSGGNVETLLFGSLLLVDWHDIAFAAVSTTVALIVAWMLHERWLLHGFDPASAPALGARSAVPDAALLGVVALLAVAALATLGALLATALLVVPAATTRLVFNRIGVWQIATVILVAIEGVAGLWLSVEVNAPPGAAIAVLAGGVFTVVACWQVLAPRRRGILAAATAAIALLGVTGCGSSNTTGSGLNVVVTTTQLGDFVRAVGGDSVRVTQILQPNTDPHEYEPRPKDVLETADAKVVFLSGDNLDHWMGDVIKQGGGHPVVTDLSKQLSDRLPGESTGPEASKYDPHWWHDPANAAVAIDEIRAALSKSDPAHAATFTARATAYTQKLVRLDTGITRCFATVPPAQRKLVTDHDAFGYFAHRYKIKVIGAVIPSQTTQAQPSARAVARLSKLIEREHVRAVFPETSLNSKLAKAIARQTGARADLTLYGDTLGKKGSRGATYLTMERANADAMIRGFTGGAHGCTIGGL